MIDWANMFKYSAITLIVLLFVILGGWYIYLKKETSTIERGDQGRGAGTEEPAPASTLGSMFSNVVAGFRKSDEPVSVQPGAESIQSGGGFRSFIARFTGKGASGISSFSGSVKDAFGNLVSDILPESKEPMRPKPPRLWHAHGAPIAGAGFIGTTTLRFMERATGHIFDVDVETGDIKRVTNTLIPKTYNASFSENGSFIAWKDVGGQFEAFTGSIATSSATSSPSRVQMNELGAGTVAAIGAQGNRFLSLISENGGYALIRSTWEGTNPERIASTALGNWHMFAGKRIVLSQAPATGISGYAYEVREGGSFIPLVRDVPGLMVLPHPEENALLISSDSGSLSLFASTTTGERFLLSVRTVAEKCVWVPGKALLAYCAVPENFSSSRFLDEWHLGLLHTEDAWWKIDAKTGDTELLFSPHSEASASLDVIAPAIDDGGKYLSFMDAEDQSLWVLRIRD